MFPPYDLSYMAYGPLYSIRQGHRTGQLPFLTTSGRQLTTSSILLLSAAMSIKWIYTQHTTVLISYYVYSISSFNIHVNYSFPMYHLASQFHSISPKTSPLRSSPQKPSPSPPQQLSALSLPAHFPPSAHQTPSAPSTSNPPAHPTSSSPRHQ